MPIDSATFATIRANLKQLDAELYDMAIPFEETARRMLSLIDATAEALASQAQPLPVAQATLLAHAVGKTMHRDLLTAREFVLDALDYTPSPPSKATTWQPRHTPTSNQHPSRTW